MILQNANALCYFAGKPDEKKFGAPFFKNLTMPITYGTEFSFNSIRTNAHFLEVGGMVYEVK